ncbi:hypothetical protein GCE9029_03004 [Grimontia celer]|uniref:Tetratricopeptide repeat protein n=1 Tax=Grimontia celer TaxID=1796497 RepID=A0A128F6G2_9GAMM|nr:hypothetical protein [Grimontia celer]CZF82060.1 hypothetical protein GCE9029_03004 [Grimontia celer]
MSNSKEQNFTSTLNQGWQQHESEPDSVFDSMASMLDSLDPEQTESAMTLLLHTAIGHLSAPEKLLHLLASLNSNQSNLPSSLRAQVVADYFSTNVLCDMSHLTTDEQHRVFTQIANEYTALENTAQASQWLTMATEGVSERSVSKPLARAIAITGNNLACRFEDLKYRTPEQDQQMIKAAQLALQYWRVAGGWIQEERAEYRLAMSLIKAGQYQDARTHAERCEAICIENEADDFERYFASDLLMLVHFHLAQSFKQNLSEELRGYCETSPLS